MDIGFNYNCDIHKVQNKTAIKTKKKRFEQTLQLMYIMKNNINHHLQDFNAISREKLKKTEMI